MAQENLPSLAKRSVGLIVALLLGEVLFPSTVYASCGDHVRYSRMGLARPNSSQRETPRPGCSGLNCFFSEQPPLHPVSPQRNITDIWTESTPRDQTGPEPGACVCDDETLCIVHRAAVIFHPPR